VAVWGSARHMTALTLRERIRQDLLTESDAILGELARLMSPALRARAEEVDHIARQISEPLPAPIAWVLGLEASSPGQVETRRPDDVPFTAPPAPPTSEPVQPASKKTEKTYTTKGGQTRRSPKHPGIRAVPKHLRHLPAAREGGPVGQRIKTAEFQQRVLDDVLAHPTAISNEVAERLGMNDANGRNRIGLHMTALMKAGLIRRTGINRRVPGNNIGKAAIEYAPPEGFVPPTTGLQHDVGQDDTADESASTVEETTSRKLTLKGAELLGKVRDYGVSREGKGPYTPVMVGEALRVPEGAALAMLSLLADRGQIKEVSLDGNIAFEYHRPTEPGAAAERDHAMAKARAKATNGHGNGGAQEVTGSGWDPKQFSPNANVRRLLRLVKEQWGVEAIRNGGSGHIIIRTPSGAQVAIGSTPNRGGERAAAQNLRKAGIKGA
jgi:hypothetical protein